VCEFNDRDIANIAWAFEMLVQLDRKRFCSIGYGSGAEDVRDQLGGHRRRGLGISDAGSVSRLAVRSISEGSGAAVCEFNDRGIASSVWAFAKPGRLDGKLFRALALAAELRMREVNAQATANAAWAFAMQDQLDKKPFATFARAVELRMSKFNAQDMAITA